MLLILEFDLEHRILYGKWQGPVDDAGFERTYSYLQSFVSTLRAQAAILDCGNIGNFDVSSPAIRYLASKPPILPDPIPRFIVAPDDLIYGLMRMFQTLGEDSRRLLRIVRSITEACDQLGVQHPKFERILELTGG
jgi:hypothetical protein